jgi:sarcosine oxidase
MYDNWAKMQERAGQNVFVQTGGLDIAVEGTPGAASVDTYRRVMTANCIPFVPLDRAELLDCFPQWSIEEDVRATYQAESGFIDIRRAKATHLALARAAGATVMDNTLARAEESTDEGVRVVTDDASYTAAKVIVCSGSWTDELLTPLGQT